MQECKKEMFFLYPFGWYILANQLNEAIQFYWPYEKARKKTLKIFAALQ